MNNLKAAITVLVTMFLILFHCIRNFFMQFKLYLFRQRVLAGVLCACLLTVSMPFPVLAVENFEDVQEEIQENTHDDIHGIVSATELPDEVNEQTDEGKESESEKSDHQSGDESGDASNEDAENPENSDRDNVETSEDSTAEGKGDAAEDSAEEGSGEVSESNAGTDDAGAEGGMDEGDAENPDGAYTLAEDGELPETSVTETEIMLAEETETLADVSESATPACGVISSDTTWGKGILSGGELIINPGVTLTIEGAVTIYEDVTIKGGGTIRRGSENAYIYAGGYRIVTVENIMIDGAGIPSGQSMINASNLTIEGCTIKDCILAHPTGGGGAIESEGSLTISDTTISNCSANRGGAICCHQKMSVNSELTMKDTTISGCSADRYGGAIYLIGSSATMENITIENCRANNGGAIYADTSTVIILEISGNCYEPDLTIKDGNFINNETNSNGGCIWIREGELKISDGEFTGNTSAGAGGCIYQSGLETVINISGGNFAGNTCTNEGYEGSGAIYTAASDGQLIICSNAHFCGDEAFGTDGIMLAGVSKVLISGTLNYLVTVYVKASEGRVIAEGTGDHIYLLKEDMEKVEFVDIGNSEEEYETVLDETNNQIRLAKIKMVTAAFYSGPDKHEEERTAKINYKTQFATLTAPSLEELSGYTPVGWSKTASGYTVYIVQGEETEISKDTPFYGVYKKNALLSYDMNLDNEKEDGNDASGSTQEPDDTLTSDTAPESQRAVIYATVNEETINYEYPRLTLAAAPSRDGYIFMGWNTAPDGGGDAYEAEANFKLRDDTTLYAIFKEIKTVTATFYSGADNKKEEISAKINDETQSAFLTAPSLYELPGYTPVGWNTSASGCNAEIAEDGGTVVSKDTSFYGVYQKVAVLTYDVNYGLGNENDASGSTQEPDAAPIPDTTPGSRTDTIYATVNDKGINYTYANFPLASAPSRDGYVFTGWNTAPGGTGDTYKAGAYFELCGDTTLYAQWMPGDARYMVEHYLQDVSGAGYTKAEADTENLNGTVGEVVNAMPKTYRGFTENTARDSREGSGLVASDGSLVLRLYYDRDVYHITFDINGASGTAPEAQELRYGALLQEIDRPQKTGYTFLGWYMSESGMEGKAWDFEKTVEENTEKKSETLYAGWVDDIAPVLMQAEFNEGYKSFHDWLIRKKDLIITIPIIEEGSGVKQADYELSLFEKSDSGNESAQAQVIEENGRTVAKITISNDFKGTVSVTCADNAGNISAGKTLASPGGGALIVEDNAPEITFSSKDGSLSDSFYGDVDVTVSVNDEGTPGNADTAEKVKIAGGIASVSYCLDNEAETAVEGKGFESGIVTSCDFSVEISGVGEHILRVTATDNAGNENTSQARIRIAQEPAQKNKIPVIPVSRKKSPVLNLPALNPSTPAAGQLIALADLPQPLKTAGSVKDDEPRTGDDSCVDLYAAIAILTGLFYLCYTLRWKELEF